MPFSSSNACEITHGCHHTMSLACLHVKRHPPSRVSARELRAREGTQAVVSNACFCVLFFLCSSHVMQGRRILKKRWEMMEEVEVGAPARCGTFTCILR
jgi:hypothetical protein